MHKLILAIVFFFSISAYSNQNDDFVVAACGGDTNKMAILFATTAVDVNVSSSTSGTTALVCAARNLDLPVLKLLGSLNGKPVDPNVTAQNGATALSAINADNCDEKCISWIHEFAAIFEGTLDLAKHLKDGLLLPAWNVRLDFKLQFVKVRSFGPLKNIKDGQGNTIFGQLVKVFFPSNGTVYEWDYVKYIPYFFQLLDLPGLDVSQIPPGSNILAIPYEINNYKLVEEFYEKIVKYKNILPFNTNWLSKDNNTLLTPDCCNYSTVNPKIAILLLDNFKFDPTILLTQENHNHSSPCGLFFKSVEVLERLIKLGGMTDQCMEVYQLVKNSNFQETKILETRYSPETYVAKDKIVIEIRNQTDSSTYQIWTKNVWPPVKQIEFAAIVGPADGVRPLWFTPNENFIVGNRRIGPNSLHYFDLQTLTTTVLKCPVNLGHPIMYIPALECGLPNPYEVFFLGLMTKATDPYSILDRKSIPDMDNNSLLTYTCLDTEHCMAMLRSEEADTFGPHTLRFLVKEKSEPWREILNYTEKNFSPRLLFRPSGLLKVNDNVRVIAQPAPRSEKGFEILFDKFTGKFSVSDRRLDYYEKGYVLGTGYRVKSEPIPGLSGIYNTSILTANFEKIAICYTPTEYGLNDSASLDFDPVTKELHYIQSVFLNLESNNKTYARSVKCH